SDNTFRCKAEKLPTPPIRWVFWARLAASLNAANKTRQARAKFTKSSGAGLAEEFGAGRGGGAGIFPASPAGPVADPGEAPSERGNSALVAGWGGGRHRRAG